MVIDPFGLLVSLVVKEGLKKIGKKFFNAIAKEDVDYKFQQKVEKTILKEFSAFSEEIYSGKQREKARKRFKKMLEDGLGGEVAIGSNNLKMVAHNLEGRDDELIADTANLIMTELKDIPCKKDYEDKEKKFENIIAFIKNSQLEIKKTIYKNEELRDIVILVMVNEILNISQEALERSQHINDYLTSSDNITFIQESLQELMEEIQKHNTKTSGKIIAKLESLVEIILQLSDIPREIQKCKEEIIYEVKGGKEEIIHEVKEGKEENRRDKEEIIQEVRGGNQKIVKKIEEQFSEILNEIKDKDERYRKLIKTIEEKDPDINKQLMKENQISSTRELREWLEQNIYPGTDTLDSRKEPKEKERTSPLSDLLTNNLAVSLGQLNLEKSSRRELIKIINEILK